MTRDVLDPLRLPNDPAKTGIPNAIPPFVQSVALGFQIKMIALAQPLHDYFVSEIMTLVSIPSIGHSSSADPIEDGVR